LRVDRRCVLAGLAGAAFMASAPGRAQQTCEAQLAVAYDDPGHAVPPDFAGLSFESALLAANDYFTPTNRSLIGLIRRLAPRGVIRIGGNTSEKTVWRLDAAYEPDRYVITPRDIDRLAAFLRVLDWQLIYGLNLARGTPDEAAAEASYVAQAIGAGLIAFQIGNEPDGFGRWSGVRPRGYDFNAFLDEWRVFHAAMRTRLPRAPFAGPDVAAETSWVAPFAQAAPEGLVLLTRHYYADGPASDPKVTLAKLLRSAPAVEPILATLEQASRSYSLPYRIAETNSVYQGGRSGVSDTFGAALWGAELMFQVAVKGGAGINFHTGDTSVYTPIAPADEGRHRAQPLYYGMLVFTQACRGELISTQFAPHSSEVAAFAAREGERLRVTLINKSIEANVCVRVDPGRVFRGGTVLRLLGPSVDAKTGVTFGDASVDDYGEWAPLGSPPLKIDGRDVIVDVPAASAAVVSLEP
jgi:hypothetical protein